MLIMIDIQTRKLPVPHSYVKESVIANPGKGKADLVRLVGAFTHSP